MKKPTQQTGKLTIHTIFATVLGGMASVWMIYIISSGPKQSDARTPTDSPQPGVQSEGGTTNNVWAAGPDASTSGSVPVPVLIDPQIEEPAPPLTPTHPALSEEAEPPQPEWDNARIAPPPIRNDPLDSAPLDWLPAGDGKATQNDQRTGTAPLVVSAGGSGGGGGGTSLGSGFAAGGGGGGGAADTGGGSGGTGTGDVVSSPIGVGLSDGSPGSIVDEYTRPLTWFSFLSAEGTPDVVAVHGFQAIELIYSVHIWEEGEDDTVLTEVQEDRLTERASEIEDGHLVCISFEQWELATSKVSEEEAEAAIDNLIRAVEAVRAGNPTLRIGIYRYLPLRSRIVVEYMYRIMEEGESLGSSLASMQAVIDRWHADNVRSMRLAEHVDVVFPSLYTIQSDAEEWSRFARVHLDEARIYGKPIYAFIRPRFGQGDLRGDLIPYDLWRTQLELLHRQADGVVFWDSSFETWTPGAAWWQATLDYQQFREENPLIMMGD